MAVYGQDLTAADTPVAWVIWFGFERDHPMTVDIRAAALSTSTSCRARRIRFAGSLLTAERRYLLPSSRLGRPPHPAGRLIDDGRCPNARPQLRDDTGAVRVHKGVLDGLASKRRPRRLGSAAPGRSNLPPSNALAGHPRILCDTARMSTHGAKTAGRRTSRRGSARTRPSDPGRLRSGDPAG
jgi:hypothetical protein